MPSYAPGLFLLPLALLSLALPARAEQSRIATVRVTDVYRGLKSALDMQESLRTDREAIEKDQRAVQLNKMFEELKVLQEQFQKLQKTDGSMAAGAEKIARDFELKRQEAEALRQEFESFKEGKTKEINVRMVSEMRVILTRISDAARKVGQEKGFDVVFESAGSSNTGVPVLLYIKSAVDITPDVVAALKDTGDPTVSGESSPAAVPQAPAPAAPGDTQ